MNNFYSTYIGKIFFNEESELKYKKPDIAGYYEAQKRYTGHSHFVVFEKNN